MGTKAYVVREPAYADGRWYPSDAAELRDLLSRLVPSIPPVRALALLAPHAGYRFSGGVAGVTYATVEVPSEVVLLCFHHRARGADIAVWPGGAWRTPIGIAAVASDLRTAIVAASPHARSDAEGHAEEHSGELQLPFLLHRNPSVAVVPISVNTQDPGRLESFGAALASVKRDFLVVASSDMSHYAPHEATVAKDAIAVKAIERLDVAGLGAAVRDQHVSMCGFAPVAAMIAYARARGATEARLVRYRTSGDVTGEMDQVVGYAGMIVPWHG